MTKEQFTTMYYPLAKKAGDRFGMNPEIILAQAALESGWGSSYGARVRKNFFGITAAGSPNEFWDGGFSVGQNQYALKFRVYKTEQDSFYDFARLISSKYKTAHAVSSDSTAYAQAIAYSPYIAEANGDSREGYRKGIISTFNSISDIVKKKALQ
ncbi:glucosaminidase domain-containing protein [Schleiferiaceae bacterium]|nr:glucosaminidase domain-containing protein [Schleiferiaceae bacterium]MDC1224783.1 glucosaminidase domain-containing protein [Schleiferiaceae bacterium]